MQSISISPEILEKCPALALGCWEGNVVVETERTDLWERIDRDLEALASRMEVADIHGLPEIHATRTAYKACGKEPSRYRPSAEALLRRVLKGKGLYRVNNVVDALNLVSVTSGFSIGGFDLERVEGKVELGIGRENEPYAAIGRGELNIAHLPLLRDQQGAFGTPTSDSNRTMVRPETKRFWMVIYAFDGSERVQAALDMASELLGQFAQATHISTAITTSP